MSWRSCVVRSIDRRFGRPTAGSWRWPATCGRASGGGAGNRPRKLSTGQGLAGDLCGGNRRELRLSPVDDVMAFPGDSGLHEEEERLGHDDETGVLGRMNMKVVLAEDDPDIQRIARLSLKRAQFDVTVASTGAEALARVAEVHPDVVLLDWMMPEMDGLTACTRLKSDPSTRDIPVIFMTAKSQESEIKQGLSLGAVGYIVKPFDALLLGARVRELLKA